VRRGKQTSGKREKKGREKKSNEMPRATRGREVEKETDEDEKNVDPRTLVNASKSPPHKKRRKEVNETPNIPET